jgi:hypothetical protein
MKKSLAFLYGLNYPRQLLEKMKIDGGSLEPNFEWTDVFNFVVTAAVLNEWVIKFYELKGTLVECLKAERVDGYPEPFERWFVDKSCFPNKNFDLKEQVRDCLSICFHVCNASKHYHWRRSGDSHGPTTIERDPQVKDWYQYFFTKAGPGLFVKINDRYYSMTQIRDILIPFYEGLLEYLDRGEQ